MSCLKSYRFFAVVGVMAAFSHVSSAQVVPDDSIVQVAANRNAVPQYQQPRGNNAAELHYQLQVLQQEVQQLRGLVEQQAHELRKLKKQRLDDYVEIDRRISQLSSRPQASARERSPAESGNRSGGTPVSKRGEDNVSASEIDEYRSAINLVLKQRNYDKAVVELNDYLTKYPRGQYAANAQYWLGEIYLLKKDLNASRQWFSRLLNEYSSHAKVPGAKYKLGTVYDLLGDKASARSLLQEVASSNTDAAELARKYLAENF